MNALPPAGKSATTAITNHNGTPCKRRENRAYLLSLGT